jgi:hypothetical protein
VHGGHGTVAEPFCGRRGRRERGDGSNVAAAPAREAQKAGARGARGAPTMAIGETETDGRRSGLPSEAQHRRGGTKSTGVGDPAVGADDNDAMWNVE